MEVLSRRKQLKQDVNVFSRFALHFSIFVGANITLWVSWLAAGGTLEFTAWPLYLSSGWGIVLLIHFYKTYRQFREQKKNGRR